MGRFWSALDTFWTAVATFAAARARGCQQRMRRAIGLPPLP